MPKKRPLLERLRLKKAVQQEVAVAWYTPQEWARVKAVAADPEVFEDSFEEWEAMATDALHDMRNAGIISFKVLISADELQAWCLAHGKPVRADARAQYVLEKRRASEESKA